MERVLIPTGAAYVIAQERFKGVLSFERTVVTVGTSIVEAAPNDPERVSLTFINLSSQPLYIAPDNQVSASRAIVLSGGGGFLSVNAVEDGILSAIDWYALANLASQALFRITVRRDVGPK